MSTDIQPTGRPLDIDAIRARLEGTTPAPWSVVSECDGWRAGRMTVVWAHGKRVFTVDQTRTHHDAEAEANVAFAAHSRTDVEALLAAVDRVTALVPSRIGAGHRIRDLVSNGDGVDVAFYAGVSFALAKVNHVLRGEQP